MTRTMLICPLLLHFLPLLCSWWHSARYDICSIECVSSRKYNTKNDSKKCCYSCSCRICLCAPIQPVRFVSSRVCCRRRGMHYKAKQRSCESWYTICPIWVVFHTVAYFCFNCSNLFSLMISQYLNFSVFCENLMVKLFVNFFDILCLYCISLPKVAQLNAQGGTLMYNMSLILPRINNDTSVELVTILHSQLSIEKECDVGVLKVVCLFQRFIKRINTFSLL